MKDDFQNCLDKKKIIPSPSMVNFVEKELKIAFSDLAEAEDRFEHHSFKWCTVTAYYAMFHAARSLLYSKGYKERSHYCLSAALHDLFVNSGTMEARLIRAFSNAMRLREDADYADEYSEDGARQALEKAKEFLGVARGILEV